MNFGKYRHYYRGRLFERVKRPLKAIEQYKLALHHEPQFAKAVACIAHLYASLGRFDDAERYFVETVRLDPANADMHFNLGYVYDQQRKFLQAISAFKEAVRLKPGIDRAWYGLGMAYAALGRHQEAAQALEEAGKLQPMSSQVWYALGMAWHHAHGPDRVREIIMHLHRFDPLTCRRLIREAERSDLAYLVKDLAM
jgi:tetratricopeptide (TPR) repeat protein